MVKINRRGGRMENEWQTERNRLVLLVKTVLQRDWSFWLRLCCKQIGPSG